MKKKRLKRKIWMISLIFTIMSMTVMMYTPTAYFKILPIMIPASILTVILPVDIICNDNKKNANRLTQTQMIETADKIKDEKISLKEKKLTNYNTDLIDDIVNDDNLTIENKKQMLKMIKSECKQNSNEEQKKYKKELT